MTPRAFLTLLYATLAVASFFPARSAFGEPQAASSKLQGTPSLPEGGWRGRAGRVGARITTHDPRPTPFLRTAPRARSPAECAVYGDMALTARALAVEGFPEDARARALGRIYLHLISQLERDDAKRYIEVLALINRAAGARGGVDPAQFAIELNTHCQRTHGDLDGVFGTDS